MSVVVFGSCEDDEYGYGPGLNRSEEDFGARGARAAPRPAARPRPQKPKPAPAKPAPKAPPPKPPPQKPKPAPAKPAPARPARSLGQTAPHVIVVQQAPPPPPQPPKSIVQRIANALLAPSQSVQAHT